MLTTAVRCEWSKAAKMWAKVDNGKIDPVLKMGTWYAKLFIAVNIMNNVKVDVWHHYLWQTGYQNNIVLL